MGLYFLGKGKELYFGPSVPHCLQFFGDAGYKCPEYENCADFLLDLVNTTGDGMDVRNEIVIKLETAYKKSNLFEAASQQIVPPEHHGDLRRDFVQSRYGKCGYLVYHYDALGVGCRLQSRHCLCLLCVAVQK